MLPFGKRRSCGLKKCGRFDACEKRFHVDNPKRFRQFFQDLDRGVTPFRFVFSEDRTDTANRKEAPRERAVADSVLGSLSNVKSTAARAVWLSVGY
jgi:hypothetical protein